MGGVGGVTRSERNVGSVWLSGNGCFLYKIFLNCAGGILCHLAKGRSESQNFPEL